jgi:hypothetical protein
MPPEYMRTSRSPVSNIVRNPNDVSVIEHARAGMSTMRRHYPGSDEWKWIQALNC